MDKWKDEWVASGWVGRWMDEWMEGGLEERSKEQILLEHDNVSEAGSIQTQAIERPWNMDGGWISWSDSFSLLLHSCRACLSTHVVLQRLTAFWAFLQGPGRTSPIREHWTESYGKNLIDTGKWRKAGWGKYNIPEVKACLDCPETAKGPVWLKPRSGWNCPPHGFRVLCLSWKGLQTRHLLRTLLLDLRFN